MEACGALGSIGPSQEEALEAEFDLGHVFAETGSSAAVLVSLTWGRAD